MLPENPRKVQTHVANSRITRRDCITAVEGTEDEEKTKKKKRKRKETREERQKNKRRGAAKRGGELRDSVS